MPVTILPPNPPGSGIGPGAPITVSSDITVDPTDTCSYIIILRVDSFQGPIFYSYRVPCNEMGPAHLLMTQPSDPGAQQVWYPPSDQTVYLQVEQLVNGVVAGQGTLSDLWDNAKWLGNQIGNMRTAAATGGFTDADRQLLTQIDTRSTVLGEPSDLVVQHASGPVQTTLGQIFSRELLDRLTLAEVTTGETFEPVRADVVLWFVGVIVRVTTIDPELVPKTPDGEWYFPDLAVLRIFRGQDLLFRRGIHTPTFMQEQPWQWGWQILNQIPILGAPPDTTVAVDWRPGCGGRVYLQTLP